MENCKRIFADTRQLSNCKELLKGNQRPFTDLSEVLSLAGNEVRLKVLFLLDQEDELCPCDLSDILEMTIPAISQHLRKLKDVGVIRSRKAGQTIFYSICEEHLPLLTPFFKIIRQTVKVVKI